MLDFGTLGGGILLRIILFFTFRVLTLSHSLRGDLIDAKRWGRGLLGGGSMWDTM